MKSKILNGLFLGAGQFAKIQLEAWRQVNHARITGIHNRTFSKAQELAGEFMIPHCSEDLEELITQLQPDFVDICTAVETHLPLVRRFSQLGIPILCQKPMASDIEQARELVDWCARHKVRLMINENWRWQCWYREIKAILEKGLLGEVHHFISVMRTSDGWGPEPYSMRPFFIKMPRFLIFETGVHYLDTFQFLFGQISALMCQARRINPVISGEDSAILFMNFKSGATGIWDANRWSWQEATRPPVNGWMSIEGSNGNLRLAKNGEIFIALRGAQEIQHHYPISEGYRGGSAIKAQQHFIDSLISGDPFESEGRDYLEIMELMESCYRSSASNSFEEIKRS